MKILGGAIAAIIVGLIVGIYKILKKTAKNDIIVEEKKQAYSNLIRLKNKQTSLEHEAFRLKNTLPDNWDDIHRMREKKGGISVFGTKSSKKTKDT